MKKIICFMLLLMICCSAFVPQKTFAAENNKVRYDVIALRAQYGTITGSNVKLRKDPGLSSTILAYMEKGAIVTVMNENSVVKDGYTWRKIVYNNTTGWVASTYLAEEMG
mgnify:CR=1 FL=1|nr:SH3 domain-containing protein [uncultured Lachnoclostridium sp.]